MVEQWKVRIGSVVLEAPADLYELLGYQQPYSNDAERWARPSDNHWSADRKKDAELLLARAVVAGLRDEAAVLQAVAWKAEQTDPRLVAQRAIAETQRLTAQAAAKAAGLEYAATKLALEKPSR